MKDSYKRRGEGREGEGREGEERGREERGAEQRVRSLVDAQARIACQLAITTKEALKITPSWGK